jgi:hypothetical protein
VNNKKYRKLCKLVSSFLFNNTYGLPLFTMDPNSPNQVFYVWWSIYRPFGLNRGWNHGSLEIKKFVYVCSTWSVVVLNPLNAELNLICHSLALLGAHLIFHVSRIRVKTRFETWITRNDVNGVCLFQLSYLITLMACLSSQRTPNVHIKYFMFDWSIYILFVLNTAWKRDFLQTLIFVNICSTWCMVQIKTGFETSITRNV